MAPTLVVLKIILQTLFKSNECVTLCVLRNVFYVNIFSV